jgi:hypothetical protein
MADQVERKLPRIVCLDCMRDVTATAIDWEIDYGRAERFWLIVECHERRIARLDDHRMELIEQAGRPLLWSELRFVTFDQSQIEQWESDATALMDRVRIVTEHFKAGGR